MSKCNRCIIHQFNSLKALTKEDLCRISQYKTSKIIKKGEVLFEEGKHVNGVFCIEEGVCKVSKKSNNGRDQILLLVKKGNLLGERSLINDEVSNLKATALSAMKVCFIPKEEVVRTFEMNPKFTLNLLKKTALALKNTDNIIVDLAQKTTKQRLASTLIYLYKNIEKDTEGAIGVQLSREDFANIIGSATESVIRILSEFKKSGVISLKKKQVFILKDAKLQQIAQGF